METTEKVLRKIKAKISDCKLFEALYWVRRKLIAFIYIIRKRVQIIINGGFPDEEVWNLGDHLARWVLPRLRKYRKKHVGYSAQYETNEEWEAAIDEMIFALETIIDDEFFELQADKKKKSRFNRAMKILKEEIFFLWD
jgi:hypothetical protein